MIAFKVPGQPQGKGRPRASVTPNGGIIMRTPDKTASYEQLIWFAYRQAGGGMMHGDLHMKIVAYRQIPGSLSAKKKADLRGRPCRSKPDIDNIIKVMCDALNAIAYKDDSQVVEVAAKKVWGDDPHVWVEIRKV